MCSSSGTSTGNCTFTQSSKLASKIQTVGIVTWSTTMSGLKSAKIDFGLDTNYGMTAPVDKPVSGNNTTLLLGMKATVSSSSPRVYHYRITATGDGGDCVSPDYTITTGALMNGLPKITIAKKSSASPVYGGFLITGQYIQMPGSSKAPAYIVDKDGEMVWAIGVSSDVTGVRMSYDGQYVWINAANVPGPSRQEVHRVSIDGEKDEDVSSKFQGCNHSLTVLPDETVAFYGYGSNGCDDIKIYDHSTGQTKTIANSGTAQGGASACHVNNIQYWKEDDSLTFSDLDNQVVVKIKRSDGSMIWVANGPKPTLTGDTWQGSEHGIHILATDSFLLFNNNSRVVAGGMGSAGGTGDGSIAIEFKLDVPGKKITKAWSYKSSIQNDIMGDVQRMDNGNTIMAFSTKGKLQEVDKNGTVLEEWTWPSVSFGYIEKRASLYGPPPK